MSKTIAALSLAIQKDIEMGDIIRHVLQLGHLYCVRLKDVQKEREFQCHMLERNIKHCQTYY